MIETFDYFKDEPRFSVFKYNFEGAKYFHFGIRDENTGYSGFGGAIDSATGQTKALFELIERTVFKTLGKKDLTSSGWAAHSSLDEAKENARFELIERDAILCAWFLRRSPAIVDYLTLDQAEQVPILQFGVGKDFHILGIIIENKHSKMLLTTVCKSIAIGREKLKIDSERACGIITDRKAIKDKELSKYHLDFCNLSKADLSWIYSDGSPINYDKDIEFKYSCYSAPLWNNSNAFVVRAKSMELQELYYGTDLDKLNIKRLKKIDPLTTEYNPLRHPVL